LNIQLETMDLQVDYIFTWWLISHYQQISFRASLFHLSKNVSHLFVGNNSKTWNFFFVDFNPIIATIFATYQQLFENFCHNNIFLAFCENLFSKNFKYTNVLATTKKVSIGASLHTAKIGFQFSLCSSIGFGVGSCISSCSSIQFNLNTYSYSSISSKWSTIPFSSSSSSMASYIFRHWNFNFVLFYGNYFEQSILFMHARYLQHF